MTKAKAVLVPSRLADVSRSDQLWMIGNGVVPQQAASALDSLLLRNATRDIRNE